MNSPLVSIIMPCLNSAQTIEIAIDSVRKQSYHNLELLIIDDGSKDLTLDIINKYCSIDARIKLFLNHSIHGVANARNIGIDIATGKYLCFLDSDDYLYPSSIERRVRCAQEKSAKLIFGSYDRLLPNGKLIAVKAKPELRYQDILKYNYIGNLTGFYDVEYFGKVFQKDIRHEDYFMWCTLLKKVNIAFSTGFDSLGVYRVNNKSLSGNKIKAFCWHWLVLRKSLNIKILPAIYFQLIYFFLSVFSRFKIYICRRR
jgi:teichuronic acid biosynthesis glycosyltransferase TuaG